MSRDLRGRCVGVGLLAAKEMIAVSPLAKVFVKAMLPRT